MKIAHLFLENNQFVLWPIARYLGGSQERTMGIIAWLGNLQEALAEAQRVQKPIFVDIYDPG